VGELFGVIIFIIVAILNALAKNYANIKQSQKSKTVNAPKPQMSGLASLDAATMQNPKRKNEFGKKPATTQKSRTKRSKTEIIPPSLEGRKTVYGDIKTGEYAQTNMNRNVPRVTVPVEQQPVAVNYGLQNRLYQDDLRRAILWSEILGKPRALKKNIR